MSATEWGFFAGLAGVVIACVVFYRLADGDTKRLGNWAFIAAAGETAVTSALTLVYWARTGVLDARESPITFFFFLDALMLGLVAGMRAFDRFLRRRRAAPLPYGMRVSHRVSPHVERANAKLTFFMLLNLTAFPLLSALAAWDTLSRLLAPG